MSETASEDSGAATDRAAAIPFMVPDKDGTTRKASVLEGHLSEMEVKAAAVLSTLKTIQARIHGTGDTAGAAKAPTTHVGRLAELQAMLSESHKLAVLVAGFV